MLRNVSVVKAKKIDRGEWVLVVLDRRTETPRLIIHGTSNGGLVVDHPEHARIALTLRVDQDKPITFEFYENAVLNKFYDFIANP